MESDELEPDDVGVGAGIIFTILFVIGSIVPFMIILFTASVVMAVL